MNKSLTFFKNLMYCFWNGLGRNGLMKKWMNISRNSDEAFYAQFYSRNYEDDGDEVNWKYKISDVT